MRLPRTSTRRGERTFLTLIDRVLPAVPYATAFQGPKYAGGLVLDERDLWPKPTSPKTPILLEIGGIAAPGYGHRRSSHHFLLWKYDANKAEFREIARLQSLGTEWVEPLKHIAMRELEQQCSDCVEHAEAAAKRVLSALETELLQLQREPQRQLMEMIYEQVCARIADSVF